jgi:hypothetical protein
MYHPDLNRDIALRAKARHPRREPVAAVGDKA